MKKAATIRLEPASDFLADEGRTSQKVLWAWVPGAARATPTLAHDQFVEALESWVKADMPCR